MVTLVRFAHSSQGTQGTLYVNGEEFCKTLELPWRENQPKVSCIPCGTYDVAVRKSPRFGKVYEVKNVPERSFILIHSGNLAGDTSQGFKSHVEGCILLGQYFGRINNQVAVLASRPTVREFMDRMDGKPFRLAVEDLTWLGS